MFIKSHLCNMIAAFLHIFVQVTCRILACFLYLPTLNTTKLTTISQSASQFGCKPIGLLLGNGIPLDSLHLIRGAFFEKVFLFSLAQLHDDRLPQHTNNIITQLMGSLFRNYQEQAGFVL